MGVVRQHRGAIAVAVIAAVVAGVLAVIAFSADGYQSRHVDLNDGGVWVTSDKDGLFGRLNKPAGSLDLALNPSGGAQSGYSLDIRQQDAAVVAWDRGTGRLLPVDVIDGQIMSDQQVPVSDTEQVELNGGTLAVLDPATGRVWATRYDPSVGLPSLAAVDQSAKPVIKFDVAGSGSSVGASLAVGTDGTVYAATTKGDVGIVRPDGSKLAEAQRTRLAHSLRTVQVTAVGSSMIVLDAAQGSVLLPGGRTVSIEADPAARLQQASDAADHAIVATSNRLYEIPLAGGPALSLFNAGTGAPAAPARLGDCVHAAWAGNPGVYARSCSGSDAKPLPLSHGNTLVQPVFRLNRGAILLNDLSLGTIYDLDTLQEVDNWTAVKPPPLVRRSKKNTKNNTALAGRDLPPKAVDDNLGARPGRTTTLHVLDNDSDPQGAILSITRIGGVEEKNVTVTTSPDGQSIELSLPPGVPATHFKYTIDDGRGLTASASVSVEARGPAENLKPRTRPGFRPTVFSVSSGGTLDLPVLDDWRDFDGDPLVVLSAKASAGRITTTPDGRLDYLAPGTGGNETITYEVSDGQSVVTQRIGVTVLGPTATTTAPPVAEPDTAHGEVGHPITIQPLANDLPGADPTNPDATLALAGTVASPAGVRVETDLKSNTLTVTATRHGTFTLNYNAAYGNARFSAAKIRVDVANSPPMAQPPVAVPDTAVLYGQAASIVDVLANDFDPAGAVLVVQHAAAVDGDQVKVAIVSGHWLRIESADAHLSPNPQVVHYTITDGLSGPVTGEVTLTQVDPPADDSPVAIDDYATVRSGDSAVIPVLDNDIDPAGAPLSLLDDVKGAPDPGALVTTTADGVASPAAGLAFVSGKTLRYAAPVVSRETTNTITYVVRNPSGGRSTGTVHVTVEPLPGVNNPDNAPAPQPISARAISGETITIRVPSSGIDPDGDSTYVAGLTSAPTIGRIVSVGATSITYQAFPTRSGTDRFGYIVSDAYGRTASAAIQVGVAQATDPQPPVAVADDVTAAPGSKLRVDVLANDVIAPGDDASIGALGQVNPDLPPGTGLATRGGPIELRAPTQDGRSQVVLYSLSDGLGPASTAALTIHSQLGYVPPPVAVDATAVPRSNAAAVTVDVLAKDSDPQGLALEVAKVFDPRATVVGARVTLPVIDRVQNVLYQIRNSQGGTAAAIIHVPARGVGPPFARAGKLITVPRNGSRTIDIADYAADPAGRPLRLTTTDQLDAAPAAGLRLDSTDPTHLEVTGLNGYIGPAAISFQVTNGTSLSDPKGQLALITVQVQVGPDTPVVRCPSTAITLVEGGPDTTLDIAGLCHVWTADPADLDALRFTGTWTDHPGGVDVSGNGTHQLTLRARGAARPGDSGSLRVTVDGTAAAPSTINVTVVRLGKPSIRSIAIDGVKAGTTVRRDVRGYLTSPLRDPAATVVQLVKTSGMPATVSHAGSGLTITPDRTSHGRMTFVMIVSDVSDVTRKDRQVYDTVTLDVLNVPDAPGAPQAGRTVLSRTVVLAWPTPAANGAPIDGYLVSWPGGSQPCPASPCRITGLTNGRSYAFSVRAHNAVGYSTASPQLAPAAMPNTLPGAIASVTATDPQDQRMTISWSAAHNEGSPILQYRVSWSGGGSRITSGTARSIVASPLVNDNVYTFTVVAVNKLGAGPPGSTQGQSAGTPPVPTGLGVDYASAAGTTTRVVNVHWNASDPNGRGPTTYTVTRDNTPICVKTQATSCTDTPATAHTYTYRVVAANSVGHPSAPASAQFRVTGTPDQVNPLRSQYTDNDSEVLLTYTVPNSHGQSSTLVCTRADGSPCGQWTPTNAPGTSGSHRVGGLPADADVTLTLKDCNEEQCGPPSAGATAHTSGPPRAPSVSCSGTASGVRFGWSGPGGYNGHSIRGYRTSLDGGAYGAETTATSRTAGGQDGNSHTLRVRAVDSRGEQGTATGSATCTDPPKPNPQTFKISMGSHVVAPDCTAGCSYIVYAVGNLTPNHNYTVNLNDSPGVYSRSYTFTTNGSGNYSHEGPGYYGGPNNGGYGTIRGSVSGTNLTDSCYGYWKGGTGCP
ncbi:MAG TPA: Ig-like domain-containing protein [Jatrophihabitans sp.]|jgi:hypothetical protein|uniref:Ig-like domain-containing protein n=1 Tax=Jatrophihabitans sp. TaxID=1932789 RepID=UPI002DFC4120|nr:Ig-like domain-containing protein [Jatrophihabitans sp.]